MIHRTPRNDDDNFDNSLYGTQTRKCVIFRSWSKMGTEQSRKWQKFLSDRWFLLTKNMIFPFFRSVSNIFIREMNLDWQNFPNWCKKKTANKGENPTEHDQQTSLCFSWGCAKTQHSLWISPRKHRRMVNKLKLYRAKFFSSNSYSSFSSLSSFSEGGELKQFETKWKGY